MIPSACVVGSGMTEKLLMNALVPLAVIVAMPLVGATIRLAQHACGLDKIPRDSELEGSSTPAVKGAVQWLPVSLVLAFCFTPSVCARIFRAWYCISYAYDETTRHSFLAEDLSVRCDGSEEHDNIMAVAWGLVVIWPIGMVLLYAAILIPCRFMLLGEAGASPLVKATAFLHRDYKTYTFR